MPDTENQETVGFFDGLPISYPFFINFILTQPLSSSKEGCINLSILRLAVPAFHMLVSDNIPSLPAVPTSRLCSIQIQRGKTWEMWSHVVMLDRQRVLQHMGDGAQPYWFLFCIKPSLVKKDALITWYFCNSLDLCTMCISSIVNDKQYWCCLVNTLGSSPQTKRVSSFFIRHHPPCVTNCLPDVSTRNQISQAPLHICILQAIKHWRWVASERGYIQSMYSFGSCIIPPSASHCCVALKL